MAIRSEAGEEMKIFASTKDRRPPASSDQLLHTNFQFPCSVPYVGLFNNGEPVAAASDQTDYCQCDGALLVGPNTTVRYIVPNDNVQGDWTTGSYPPAADWSSSPLCIGYDAAPNSLCEGLVLYEPLDGDTLDQGVSLDVSGSTNIHNGEPRGTGWQVAAAQIDKGMSISCSVGDGRGFIGHDSIRTWILAKMQTLLFLFGQSEIKNFLQTMEFRSLPQTVLMSRDDLVG